MIVKIYFKHDLKNKVEVYINLCMLVTQSCLTLCNPMDCSPPGSSVHEEFSRQEFWSGVPFPPPGDLPDPGVEPGSLVSSSLAGGSFTTEPSGKPGVCSVS